MTDYRLSVKLKPGTREAVEEAAALVRRARGLLAEQLGEEPAGRMLRELVHEVVDGSLEGVEVVALEDDAV